MVGVLTNHDALLMAGEDTSHSGSNKNCLYSDAMKSPLYIQTKSNFPGSIFIHEIPDCLKYDIIITGGGMAGLSLAYYLNRSALRDKKILIIDREKKTRNDRTWAFWQEGESAFESILYRKWNSIWFHGSNGFSRKLTLGKHQYKLLRGIDFYQFIHHELATNPAIEFLYSPIQSILSDNQEAIVQTEAGEYRASWCFDSTHVLQAMKPLPASGFVYQNLLQHFKGWVIRTNQPAFDPQVPIMMDFRIDQQNECRFVYVMPFSETEALIEFTLFTPALLSKKEYDEGLKSYIQEFTSIQHYEILEEEFGVIPMSDEPAQEQAAPRVIRVGTAGGYTRASTGYTFTRTQKRLQQLVHNLERSFDVSPVTHKAIPALNYFYDQVFLNVFLKKRVSTAAIFTGLFQKNPAPRIFRFLDEESSLAEDLKVIVSVPILPFTKAAIDIFKRNIQEFRQG
ncbi:lycopene cyclase family protein [Siphonobacter sp. SORGH_AS_1065]|uniref:lycopene cyclase family protein n=1 Tax=Siphonobacter sp. SORGH_AS_1065 TaxID=3041795 RepID=UPI002781DD95|nr:lycopene cyclase family protein [Siphonobacter sp. SORGH_AS_1065]MDQ1088687.1 lycopene beta-cyclase [Siphonobacter sp. SORGH_AS_1065]